MVSPASDLARSSGDFVPAIAAKLAAGLLPGDAVFSDAALAEASRFVLAAAQRRSGSEAAIALESVPGPVGERLMRIAAINDDMPFLVDSVAAAIAAQGIVINRLVHPVIPVRRNAEGVLTDLPEGDAAGEKRESMIYIEMGRVDARSRRQLSDALGVALADVQAAVTDWPAMQAAMAADADRLPDAEGAALLRWFKDGMLTQLGHVIRRRDDKPGGGSQRGALGICRRSAKALLAPENYERAFAWFDGDVARGGEAHGNAPLIVKSNHLAFVHRRVPLDLFIVPIFEEGKVSALSVHAGVWTSIALATPPDRIPRMRNALGALMERFGFAPQGHDGKALVHALTTLPHDLLIGFSNAALERVATSMMGLVDRPRPRVVLVRAPLDRHLFAFVWLPRDAVSTAVRLEVQAMLEMSAGAVVLDWSLEVEGSSLAMLRFVLDIRGGTEMPDEAALEARLLMMVRGWGEAVEAELVAGEEPARAAALAARFAEGFPLAYRAAYGAAEAATDILRLRHLSADGTQQDGTGESGRGARLYRKSGDMDGSLRMKLYRRAGSLALSDAVPMLENFGFRVLAESATLLGGGALGAVHDFQLTLPAGVEPAALLGRTEPIEAAVAAVLNRQTDDDPFNRLISTGGLAAREAGWLRAWYRYLRQAGMAFDRPTVVAALSRAPQVTQGLIALFIARHDPGFLGDRAAAELSASAAIRDGLGQVGAINDDRLLRAYRALVTAIVRTNAFIAPTKTPVGAAPDQPPEIALAFKLDSALVPGLPKPVPWREIFVCSPRVEGIHLRAGPVARGGLRWSDRRDDFRTEVLGLMKAQRVKNAVIVPTGAKGGFYPKQLPDPLTDREGWLAEGKASYMVFVRSLLSLTDNIVGGKVVHPAGMVVRDGDDPYFVVAADKGTATYSDTANAIAQSVDFWLDDAFASGGSKGYDHKVMGITARGAWLSVQRHFLELGVDVQADPILVAGCGDMSGDVFGNGMLLSQSIRLVAAFDHRHIFIDPAPDPAISHAERKRLFALTRSSWDDYDKSLISGGGGVFPRSQKEIELSPEMRAVLGIDAKAIDPDGLISAILRSPVDLMWFGGIGTYVKAAAENNVQVGDPANDALRVDGSEVRARVIGEGGNLGCTQAGRIAFALAGGRINTDFIDNSAGVDCSDHEVNIKIALAAAQRAGRLTEPARVRLLHAMTSSVAELVLEDNRLQALALSIAEASGAAAVAPFIRVAEMLEESGQLDRRTEGLADSEALNRRAADGFGLTRPEIAVLLSSAKLALQSAIEASDLPDDPGLPGELLAAFPAEMRGKFRREIAGHRLRREIVSTRIANRFVNRLGMVHPFELIEEEGATMAQAAAAFVAAERLLGMDAVWQAIEQAAMPEAARVLLFTRAAEAMRGQIADLLRAGAGLAAPSKLVAELDPGVRELSAAAPMLLGQQAQGRSARMNAELVAAGASADEAAKVVHLFDLDGAAGLARLAREIGIDPRSLTQAFGAVGAQLGLDWAQGTAARMSPSDPWDRLLVAGLARDFQQMRLEFLRRLIGRRSNKAKAESDPEAAVAQWAEKLAPAIRQFRSLVSRAQAATTVTPAMLAQIASQARNLLARADLR